LHNSRQILKHMGFLLNFRGFVLFQTLCIKWDFITIFIPQYFKFA
jgi:hypothetical protein